MTKFRPRPGTVWETLDDDYKRKFVEITAYFRNMRYCRACGIGWKPNEGNCCPKCKCVSYYKRGKLHLKPEQAIEELEKEKL